MSEFPQLKTGAVAQYPARKTVTLAADTSFRVNKNCFHAFTSFRMGRDEFRPERDSVGLFA